VTRGRSALRRGGLTNATLCITRRPVDQWERIKDFLPGREGHVGGTVADNRLFVEAVLYRFRAGIPWRDLPERFGDWKIEEKLRDRIVYLGYDWYESRGIRMTRVVHCQRKIFHKGHAAVQIDVNASRWPNTLLSGDNSKNFARNVSSCSPRSMGAVSPQKVPTTGTPSEIFTCRCSERRISLALISHPIRCIGAPNQRK
jgi:transposase